MELFIATVPLFPYGILSWEKKNILQRFIVNFFKLKKDITELVKFSITSEEKASDGRKLSVNEPLITIFSNESRKK